MSIAVTLALLAAIGYGTSDFVGGLGSRRAPTLSILVISQLVGAAAMLVVALTAPGAPTLAHLAWGLLAGVGSAAGSIFLLRGLARGRMATVAPTSAVCAAALPVLAGIVGGERLVTVVWIGLVLALPGIWLVSRQAPAEAASAASASPTHERAALVDGLLGGLGFGVLFVALGQIPASAGTMPLVLSLLTGALVTVVAAAVLRQTWLPTRAAAGWGVTSGLLGVSGTVAFVEASHLTDLGVVAVLASLYPAVTVLLARILLGEGLGAEQRLGLVFCCTAVALITAG